MVDPKTRLITSDISNLTKTTSKWQKFPVERRTYAYEPTNPDDIMLTWVSLSEPRQYQLLPLTRYTVGRPESGRPVS